MWTFIIGSGLLHCAYMISAEIFEPLINRFYEITGISRENRLWSIFQMFRTFVLVSIGFVFFRSDSLTMAFGIFKGMGKADFGLFTAEGFMGLGLDIADAVVLFVSVIIFGFYGQGYDASSFIYSKF